MGGLLGLLVGVLAQAAASALTPEQAQTIPTAQLARTVLGEAGTTVVRVERPTRRDCAGFCPSLTEEEVERRKGPPPLSGLLFFQRPTAVFSAQSNWSGLCSGGHLSRQSVAVFEASRSSHKPRKGAYGLFMLSTESNVFGRLPCGDPTIVNAIST